MFIPPHCPNPECEAYLNVPETPWYRINSPCQTITFGSVPIFIQSCVTDMLKRANGVSLDVTGLLSTGSEIDGYIAPPLRPCFGLTPKKIPNNYVS